MEVIKQILISLALQLLCTVGIVVAVGLIISLANKWFYSSFKRGGAGIMLFTGVIGTPIHEAGHAIACLLFGHKIKEIKFFQVSDDGILGYVNHSYNPKSLYQRVGNFFIGIAPIYFGAAVMLLLLWLLVPSAFFGIANSAAISDVSAHAVFSALWSGVKSMFSAANFTDWKFYVFLILAFFITLHMTLSKKDVSGSLSGFMVLLLLMAAVSAIIGIISVAAIKSYTAFICAAGMYILCFMLIALILAAIAFLIGALVRLILKLGRR